MSRAKHRTPTRQEAAAWFHQVCDFLQRRVPVGFLKHAAAALATLLVVMGVALAARTAPDPPTVAAGPSPTRVFPDEPQGMRVPEPEPMLVVPPAPVETRGDAPGVAAPRPVRKPAPAPQVVIVTPPAPQLITPEPAPVVVPQQTQAPSAPVAEPQYRVQRDKPAYRPQTGRGTESRTERELGCAVVCVELGDQPDERPQERYHEQEDGSR